MIRYYICGLRVPAGFYLHESASESVFRCAGGICIVSGGPRLQETPVATDEWPVKKGSGKNTVDPTLHTYNNNNNSQITSYIRKRDGTPYIIYIQ